MRYSPPNHLQCISLGGEGGGEVVCNIYFYFFSIEAANYLQAIAPFPESVVGGKRSFATHFGKRWLVRSTFPQNKSNLQIKKKEKKFFPQYDNIQTLTDETHNYNNYYNDYVNDVVMVMISFVSLLNGYFLCHDKCWGWGFE